ncbi:50S ribosomal protein L6 [Candidatus Providencia siddallii]|uniref:50S ribosomal protein L6 n=1 Tax=Candidatus Providencia siddallii TaxID=1715285 RepID=A0A0M6W8Y4_9GAMM|nr:50S ribosomal protein L6 [Candidatus Providencia siddallii]
MSRVAKAPITVPADVGVKIIGQIISLYTKSGTLTRTIHNSVKIKFENRRLIITTKEGFENAYIQAGTTRSLLNSMVIGITKGFIKKLQLIGVGYRVSIKDNTINLFLGFSHSIEYILPTVITAECPTQTEIILKSIDKQMLGQTAAKLRSYRKPEPYKGKGIRYADEIVRTKEIKNKKK